MVKFNDPRGDPVEETAVMGDEKTGGGSGIEKFFDPFDSIDVEVVGRFIEQEEIGGGNDGFGEGDPPFFATGKVGAAFIGHIGKVKFIEYGIEPDFGDPGIVQIEEVFDIGVSGGVDITVFVTFKLGVDKLQTGPDVFGDSKLGIEFKILGQIGTAEVAHPGESGTFSGRFVTGDDFQQGGFAATVAADEGDFFTGGDGKFGLIIENLTADRER